MSTAPATAPLIHTSAKQVPADAARSQATASANAGQNVQMPASTSFGRDRNYRWLVGTLTYCPYQRAWLLRYVPYEEDDRYGGCVTLVGVAPQTSYKSGQIVRVEGALIDPYSRQLQPAYQVQSIRIVGS